MTSATGRVESLPFPSQMDRIPDSEIDPSTGFSVKITTERLLLWSVRGEAQDYENYGALYADKEVMQLFATGETQSSEYVRNRIDNVWNRRWSQGDPYSAFAVYLRGSSSSFHTHEHGEFIGNIVLGHSGTPGEAELAGMGFPRYWNQGYGKEAAEAIVREYAPKTVDWGCNIDGVPLQSIIATARPDNPASCRILESIGMSCFKTEEKFGSSRSHYRISLTDLR